MDLGLLEYALFVILGLWATLFVDNAVARAAGLLLIILATLRAFTERDSPQVRSPLTPPDANHPPELADDLAPDPNEGANVNPADEGPLKPPRPRKRVL